MKLKDIYKLIIKSGIKEDLRTKKQIKKSFSEKKKEFNKLKPFEKKFFDKEALRNPYSDTRILFGNSNSDIKRILVGIDIGIGELILADYLSKNGRKVDLVLSHHPSGIALSCLYDVMHLQADILTNFGIEEKIAKDLMKKRIDEVARKLHSSNHTRIVDAAKLFNIPFMCCHTPADNHVANYLLKLVKNKENIKLDNLISLLLKEPEYVDGAYNNAGPKILVGKQKDKIGKVLVDMTGGTEGSKDIFARLSQAGVKTILGMHMSEAHYDKVRSEHINVVMAGHIASDNLGMNLILDKLQKKYKFEIIECSGFRRFTR